MPITDLVIAETPEATAISEAASLDRWQSIDISIIGDVALHELVAHLTERDFQDVFNSIPNLTPGPDDSEPWDEDAWVTPVLQPSKEYLAAITDIPDSKLPEVGAWWFTIDTFRHNREHVVDFTKSLVVHELKLIRDFLTAANGRTVLMRLAATAVRTRWAGMHPIVGTFGKACFSNA